MLFSELEDGIPDLALVLFESLSSCVIEGLLTPDASRFVTGCFLATAGTLDQPNWL